MKNTLLIAERCNVTIPSGENHLPNFAVPEGFTLDDYFEHVVRQGYAQRLERLRQLDAEGKLRQHARAVRRAARLRDRDDQEDGVSRLLPDRLGLHPLRAREGHSGRPGPRLGGRQPGRLGAAHHRRRSALLRPDFRALPQSRARVAARYRRRLLRAAPRRGDRVRHREVRPRERLADHHVRHHEGEGRHSRRRPRHGHAVRGRRSHRQADSAGARHDARQGARREPGAARDGEERLARQRRARDGQAPRGRVAQRRRPRRRRRHRARARSPTTRRSSRATATKSRRSGR